MEIDIWNGARIMCNSIERLAEAMEVLLDGAFEPRTLHNLASGLTAQGYGLVRAKDARIAELEATLLDLHRRFA